LTRAFRSVFFSEAGLIPEHARFFRGVRRSAFLFMQRKSIVRMNARNFCAAASTGGIL